jgi:hypothetical protein
MVLLECAALRCTALQIFAGVMRAKGCFWTTAEPGTRVDYSLVGNIANLIINTTWAKVGMDMLNQGLQSGRFADRTASVEKAMARLTADAARLKEEGLWDPVTHDRRVSKSLSLSSKQ